MPTDPPTRRVARFAWEEVDTALLRAMLVARYRADGREQDIAELGRINDESIPGQVARSLGQPLELRHMPHLVNVLRDRWLPQIEADELAALCESVKLGLHGDERRQRTRTRRQQLEFLRQRNNTDNLQRNLRSWFLKLHKAHTDVPLRPRGELEAARPTELLGQGETSDRQPYPHQQDAWGKLDELADGRLGSHRGLLVLPTGAGKTWTVVAWLMKRLDAHPTLRVLWLAGQQELVDQAAREFQLEATTMPQAFRRRLRIIHSNASPATVLADDDLHVLCATRQSIIGRGLDAAARNRLRRFLSRPTIVVVDEAHHAVAAGYQGLLALIEELRPGTLTLGLTATPWPQGAGMTAKLAETLPVRVAEVQVRDLVKQEILARPQIHALDTGLRVDLDPDELNQANARDLPPSVLRRLDRTERNTLVVETYQADAARWGKTLVFDCDIEHADSLHKAFQDRGIGSQVLHSGIDGDRREILKRFRSTADAPVLISVGMLLEGVDLPAATTAFLTRPTTSRVLMRQMIGRVLRGPAAGGSLVAHIVDLRDRWQDEVDILGPGDIPGQPPTGTTGSGERELPPIRDDVSGDPLPQDVENAVRRVLAARYATAAKASLRRVELVGFLELADRNVPVFAHAREPWDLLLASARRGPTWKRSPLELFDDIAPPQPAEADVRAVVEFIRFTDTEPPLIEFTSTLDLRSIAEGLRALGPLDEQQRLEHLQAQYTSTLARLTYPTFGAFHDAVHRELVRFQEIGRTRSDPENIGSPNRQRPAESLVREEDRELSPLLESAIRRGRALLTGADDAVYGWVLDHHPPEAEWTQRPVKTTLAHWSPRLHGRKKGTPVIRVNVMLRASPRQVPDELLEYLLWHELCHHLLPMRGHDSEFRRLEQLWPHAVELDHQLDTLTERYDLSAGRALR